MWKKESPAAQEDALLLKVCFNLDFEYGKIDLKDSRNLPGLEKKNGT